jgi:hypothetical protein
MGSTLYSLTSKLCLKMVHPRRFELLTYSFGGCRSIQLSYGCSLLSVAEITPLDDTQSPHPQRTMTLMKILARCALLASPLLALSTLNLPAALAQAPVTDHGTSVNGKPLASPPAVAEVTLAGKALTIHYNTPSMRGRKIMGEVVPYGQVWRTGANPATSFVTAGDLMVGNLKVPAGAYTLYTLPAAPGTPWLLIINKQTGQWGTVYKPEMDLGRTPLMSSKLPSPQEVMSISFEHSTPTSTQLHIKWETTDEYVKVEAAK